MIRKPTKRHSRKPGERVHSDLRKKKKKHQIELQTLSKPKHEKGASGLEVRLSPNRFSKLRVEV